MNRRLLPSTTKYQTPSSDLSLENATTVFSFAMGVFIVMCSIFLGIIHHRKSNSPALRFLAHTFTYPFYISASMTSFLILIAVWYSNADEISTIGYLIIGMVMVGIVSVVGLVSVIGCKYYRSFLYWYYSKSKHTQSKKSDAKSLVMFGFVVIFCMIIILGGLAHPWLFKNGNDGGFYTFIIFSNILLFIYTTGASMFSKIAQLQWYVCCAFLFNNYSILLFFLFIEG